MEGVARGLALQATSKATGRLISVGLGDRLELTVKDKSPFWLGIEYEEKGTGSEKLFSSWLDITSQIPYTYEGSMWVIPDKEYDLIFYQSFDVVKPPTVAGLNNLVSATVRRSDDCKDGPIVTEYRRPCSLCVVKQEIPHPRPGRLRGGRGWADQGRRPVRIQVR